MQREKRKSYRERYFENWDAVKEPARNRKGYRMVYRYVGMFCRYAPQGQGRTLQSVKLRMVLAMLLGMLAAISAGLADVPFNHCRPANGFGVLSVAACLIGAYGVLRFAVSGEYMKRMTADEVDRCIRIGCTAHAVLLMLSAASGGAALISDGSGTAADVIVILAVLLSAGCSLAIRRMFCNLLMTMHKNANGRPVP